MAPHRCSVPKGLRITQRYIQVLPRNKEPVHALRQGADQFRALPFRKSGLSVECGPANEIDLAVAQRLIGIVNGEDQLIVMSRPSFSKKPSSTAAGAGR